MIWSCRLNRPQNLCITEVSMKTKVSTYACSPPWSSNCQSLSLSQGYNVHQSLMQPILFNWLQFILTIMNNYHYLLSTHSFVN